MLTVFGTSTQASVTFDQLLALVGPRFADRTVVVPYTSAVIREKLNASGPDRARQTLSPAEMLEKLKKDGYTDIAVVSTLLFPGVEYDKLKETVESFAANNSGITVRHAPPLLADAANLRPVVATLRKHMSAGGANVVVAHGTHEGHPAQQIYLDLAEQVAAAYPNARLGSIEGEPSLDPALDFAAAAPGMDVRFVVFMFVAGDHAENDIAGEEEDSLFAKVKKTGKIPSVAWVDTAAGRRIASLGLDPDYLALLLAHYETHVTGAR
jgi:sirohydrochlorin cobaltochelatase